MTKEERLSNLRHTVRQLTFDTQTLATRLEAYNRVKVEAYKALVELENEVEDEPES